MGPSHWIVCAALLGGVSLACRASAPHATGETDAVGRTGAERVRIGVVDWYVDYGEALRAALELERPLWVHFGENPG